MMFNYQWKLADGYPAKDIEKHGLKVFSTFSCGGGSSMGYKLAGYDLIGANDIDPQMMKVYKANHHPKHYILAPVKELITMNLPDELFDLDILDGSPPCSTFSTAGLRDKAWGREKKFREGQAKQILDDLFFDFIAVAKRLQPKVVISENVSGMVKGNAKGHVLEIFKQFDEAGYDTQLFLLNAATMGVPQKRQRVFFLSRRKDLKLPKIDLSFNESPILFKDVSDAEDRHCNLTNTYINYWHGTRQGESVGKFAQKRKIKVNDVCNTILATGRHFHPNIPRELNDVEIIKTSTFPLDYDFMDVEVNYLCGMSVPPVMMAQVAYQVYKQWLSKIIGK